MWIHLLGLVHLAVTRYLLQKTNSIQTLEMHIEVTLVNNQEQLQQPQLYAALIHAINTILIDQLPACHVLRKVYTVLVKNIQQHHVDKFCDRKAQFKVALSCRRATCGPPAVLKNNYKRQPRSLFT
jgi:hypothetical protein